MLVAPPMYEARATTNGSCARRRANSAIRLPRAAAGRATLRSLMASETPIYLDDNFTPEQIAAWPEWHSRLEEGRAQSFADYLHAQHARASIHQEMNDVLREVDVIAMPTGSTFGDAWNAETTTIRGREVPARSRAVYRNATASLSGQPALSVPCGFGLGDRLPVGLMLQGRPMDEGLLYRIGHAYEGATQWHTRYPLS